MTAIMTMNDNYVDDDVHKEHFLLNMKLVSKRMVFHCSVLAFSATFSFRVKAFSMMFQKVDSIQEEENHFLQLQHCSQFGFGLSKVQTG